MNLKNLDEEQIKAAAAAAFPDYVIRVDTTDVFLQNVEDGTYISDFLESEFYVSTQYAYEDILVNGNKTRYKIHMNTIELLDDAYSVNYNWNDRYYAVYEIENKIHFMKYTEFLSFIKSSLQKQS